MELLVIELAFRVEDDAGDVVRLPRRLEDPLPGLLGHERFLGPPSFHGPLPQLGGRGVDLVHDVVRPNAGVVTAGQGLPERPDVDADPAPPDLIRVPGLRVRRLRRDMAGEEGLDELVGQDLILDDADVLGRERLFPGDDAEEGLVVGVGVLQELLDHRPAADCRLQGVAAHEEELLSVGVGLQPIAEHPVDGVEVVILFLLAVAEDEGTGEEQVLEGHFDKVLRGPDLLGEAEVRLKVDDHGLRVALPHPRSSRLNFCEANLRKSWW